jgi:hypothetical protein
MGIQWLKHGDWSLKKPGCHRDLQRVLGFLGFCGHFWTIQVLESALRKILPEPPSILGVTSRAWKVKPIHFGPMSSQSSQDGANAKVAAAATSLRASEATWAGWWKNPWKHHLEILEIDSVDDFRASIFRIPFSIFLIHVRQLAWRQLKRLGARITTFIAVQLCNYI